MSMRTIAQMTGLSVTTVSHALNGTRAVSKRSMDLINEAAAKINYRPNLAAQMMKTQRSRTVALGSDDEDPALTNGRADHSGNGTE